MLWEISCCHWNKAVLKLFLPRKKKHYCKIPYHRDYKRLAEDLLKHHLWTEGSVACTSNNFTGWFNSHVDAGWTSEEILCEHTAYTWKPLWKCSWTKVLHVHMYVIVTKGIAQVIWSYQHHVFLVFFYLVVICVYCHSFSLLDYFLSSVPLYVHVPLDHLPPIHFLSSTPIS